MNTQTSFLLLCLFFFVSCSKDETPPTITILGENPLYTPLNVSYNDPGATAYDDEDGDITSYIYTEENVITSECGHYTYNYSVEDFSGNTANETREICVVIKNESLQGSWNVSHSCNSLIGINDIQNFDIDGNDDDLIIISDFSFLASLSLMLDDRNVTVPQQSIELGADVSGTGDINSTGDYMTLNLDFSIPVIGNESCLLVYTKQ